jgi:hydroxyacylglutathione hydrolase
MYLIVGQTRALVIDAGSGFCDFKGIIENITKLPYDIAITHGHPDHAGGMGQFDMVYIHPADTAMAKKISYEQSVQYGEMMHNMTSGIESVWGYSKNNVAKYAKQPEIKLLSDGQVFDLGDRKVTVYYAPGHSLGSCTFLDDQSRILFSGDAANGNVSTGIAVSTTLRYFIRLQKLRTDYDQMYFGHVAYAGNIPALSHQAGNIDVLPQKPVVLDDVIEAFRSVLLGNARIEKVQNNLFPERTQTVAVYGVAEVGFNPDKLWEQGEEHIVP